MKTCPSCATEIPPEATVCPHCESALPPSAVKWYFSTWAIIGAFLAAGPFALPLVWLHPRYSKATKIAFTVALLALTAWLCWVAWELAMRFIEQLRDLGYEL